MNIFECKNPAVIPPFQGFLSSSFFFSGLRPELVYFAISGLYD